MLAICSALLGSLFGIWYRVIVLVPATLIGATLLVGTASAAGAGLARTLASIAVFSLMLQAGYVCATVIRALAIPGSNPRSSRLAAPVVGDRGTQAH
jgi:hypothetical protein